jgi:Transposase IS116/IS110/IS902 family
LIAGIGDITRFSSSAKLARYTGCAPIAVDSSDKDATACTKVEPATSAASPYRSHSAKTLTPRSTGAASRHEPIKGSRGARRILQRHLIDVIHRAMTADYASRQHNITRQPLTA